MSLIIEIERIRMKFTPIVLLFVIFILLCILIFVYTQIGFVFEIFAFLGVFIAILVIMLLVYPRYQRWYIGFLTKHKYYRWFLGLSIIISIVAVFLNSEIGMFEARVISTNNYFTFKDDSPRGNYGELAKIPIVIYTLGQEEPIPNVEGYYTYGLDVTVKNPSGEIQTRVTNVFFYTHNIKYPITRDISLFRKIGSNECGLWDQLGEWEIIKLDLYGCYIGSSGCDEFNFPKRDGLIGTEIITVKYMPSIEITLSGETEAYDGESLTLFYTISNKGSIDSFVNYKIFLDENQNGKYDDGEKIYKSQIIDLIINSNHQDSLTLIGEFDNTIDGFLPIMAEYNIEETSDSWDSYGFSNTCNIHIIPKTYIVTVSTIPPGQMVTLTPDKEEYTADEIVTILAHIDSSIYPYYDFSYWEGSIYGNDPETNPLQIQVEEDIILTAHYIIQHEPPPPTVSIGGPYEGIVGTLVEFSGSATGGKLPYSWSWDFGDGSSSSEQNPLYSYKEEGEYTVILRATGSDGKSSVDTTTVNVFSDSDSTPGFVIFCFILSLFLVIYVKRGEKNENK
jgi:PKD repeat protein